jgi:hypothetical protein
MNLLVCRLEIVFQIHAFFVERKLLFIASLQPSISAAVHSCVKTLAVDGNCKIAIVPYFCTLSLSLSASTSTFNTKSLSLSLDQERV